MSQTMYGVHYASSVDGFKVLKLPYKHGSGADDTHYSMYIFLPDDHQGIAGMVDAITAGPEYLYSVLPKTANKSTVLTVRLPKFETSFDWDLGDDLRLMGLSLPFSPESADLRGIFHKNHSTYLSKVLHKAVVKVDEDGTEAAAATVVLMKGAGRKPPTEFVADHPFTFFIMEERSGVIVFAGHVLDPTNRSASKL
jgi:serpin B